MLVRALACLALFVPSVAEAGEWYLETPDRPQRSEVAQWEEAAVAAGTEARLVRRFVDGVGWRFLLRSEGYADQATAEAAAHQLADQLSLEIGLFEIDGARAARRGEVGPQRAAPPAAAPSATERDAAPFLEAAVAAIGVDEAWLGKLANGPVLFAYRRTLPDGTEVDHTWAASGTSAFVELEKVSGNVVPSRIKVLADQAFLSVSGAAWSSQNTEKARTLVESMGPMEVIPLVLQLARAVETRREFERMEVTGVGTFDGAPTTVLSYGGDAGTEALTVEVGADGLPCRVKFGDDDAVHEFRQWRKQRSGPTLPGEITTWRNGARSDTVTLETLDVAANLPAEWFRSR